MKQPGRYAAGTKSKLSKWLRALGLKRFSSTQDIADYENGVTLKAACLLPVLRRGLYGYLHLGKGRPVVWRNRTGSRSLTFHGDFVLTPAAVPRGLRITARLFAYFILSAGTEHLLIAVIKEDLPLVRHALSIPDDYGAAEARAGQPGQPEEASIREFRLQDPSTVREQALTPRSGFRYLARGLPWWQQVVALAPLASVPFVGAIGGGFAGAAAWANVSVARKPLPALAKVVAMITVWVLAFAGYATVVTGIHLAMSSPTASTTAGSQVSTQPAAPQVAPQIPVTPSPTPSPPSPTAVDVDQPSVIHPTGAELSWPQYANTTGDPSYDVAEYQVHRAATSFFTPSATTLVAQLDAQHTSFVDTTVTPAAAESPAGYCYYMVAVLTKSGKLIPGPDRLVQLPQTGRTTVAIPATATATLSSAQPGSVVDHIGNDGMPGAAVEVGDDANGLGTTRAMFGFGPLPVPAGAFVVDARLRLSGGSSGVNARYSVHALSRGFTASEATWNSAATGTAWAKPGGDYSKLEGLGLPSPGEAGSLADLDATAIVRGWLGSPTADHDLLLKLADETSASHDRAIFAGMKPDRTGSQDPRVSGLGTGRAGEPPIMMITYLSGPPDTPYLRAWMPDVMRPGDTVPVPVVVRNTSATSWPAGRVQLTWHWMLTDGTGLASGQAALPTSLAPGAETTVTVQMTAPRTSYTQIRIAVQWDMYDTGTHTRTSAREGVQQQLVEVDSQ